MFSQFVNMLDLVEYRLQRGGVKCLKLLGHLTVEQRDTIIRAFKEDPTVKVRRPLLLRPALPTSSPVCDNVS